MTLPPAIANLGAPKGASPDLMSKLRAEKARQAKLLEEREINRCRELADYIENHHETINEARHRAERLLASPDHVRLHWALKKWMEVFAKCSPSEIAGLLRDGSQATRELRETCPIARPAGARA